MQYTVDDFLGGKIKLKQGDYRATSDAVLLAAAIKAKTGQTVLDVGCGTGAAILCLMARQKDLKATAIDIQEEMLTLAKENANMNGFDVEFLQMDIAQPTKEMHDRQFDHVLTNPPYFTETPLRENKVTAKAHQQQTSLKTWLDFCIKKVKAKGTLTIIHRTEAVPEILSVLNGRMGKITLIPLYPKAGTAPKRVIIQATQNTRTPFSIHTGFVLHNADDTRTDWAEGIMRKGNSML